MIQLNVHRNLVGESVSPVLSNDCLSPLITNLAFNLANEPSSLYFILRNMCGGIIPFKEFSGI